MRSPSYIHIFITIDSDLSFYKMSEYVDIFMNIKSTWVTLVIISELLFLLKSWGVAIIYYKEIQFFE